MKKTNTKKKKSKKIENLAQKILVWFLLIIMVGSFFAGLAVYLLY